MQSIKTTSKGSCVGGLDLGNLGCVYTGTPIILFLFGQKANHIRLFSELIWLVKIPIIGKRAELACLCKHRLCYPELVSHRGFTPSCSWSSSVRLTCWTFCLLKHWPDTTDRMFLLWCWGLKTLKTFPSWAYFTLSLITLAAQFFYYYFF